MFARLAAALNRDRSSAAEDALGTLALFLLLIAGLSLPGLA